MSAGVALVLAGCGGGDDETTTNTTAATPQTTTSQSKKPSKEKKGSSGDKTTTQGSDSTSAGAPQEGSKAPAPGVPVTKGGDNSIQTYGLEAGSDERAQITAIVKGYFDAIAAGNWEKACSYLVSQQQQQYAQLAQQLPDKSKGSGCGAAVGALNSRIPKRDRVEQTKFDVLSLRTGDDNALGRENAFLIYKGTDGKVYATVATREDDQWKLLNGGRTPLFPTSADPNG